MTLNNVNNVNNNNNNSNSSNSSNNNSNHLPTQFQKFIHTSKYARWMPEEGRRESWPETVGRYVDNVIYNEIGGKPENADIILALEDAILNCEIMPSMRCMMTAGKALDRSNVAGFNCSYTPVDHPQVFSEILFILMNGTGVGFSCEKKYVDELPKITGCFHDYCDDEA
jgi:ribonucleoside-triphosphate reductase